MSLLPRTPEPEVMDSEAEARDYDAMDHEQVNASFCADLLAVRPRPRHVLDVGTGTALIAIELCRRSPEARALGIDLACHMLNLAAQNVQRARMEGRIHLAKMDAKATAWSAGTFDTVISNSLVHHIPDPRAVFEEMWRLVADGGVLFVRDLARPTDAAQVETLALRYASAPEGHGSNADSETRMMHARQRALFVASLHASLTVDEVRAMIAPLGVPGDAVCMTSDRHWTLAHVRS
jgi:ubiquinone/menaquinone biosynthesis C-methylase UbiE